MAFLRVFQTEVKEHGERKDNRRNCASYLKEKQVGNCENETKCSYIYCNNQGIKDKHKLYVCVGVI